MGNVDCFIAALLCASLLSRRSGASGTSAQTEEDLPEVELGGNITVATFNTFLAMRENATLLAQRQQVLESSFSNGAFAEMADVVCLQEVEEREQLDTLKLAAQEGGFPYSVSFPDDIDTKQLAILARQSACNPVEVLRLSACIQQKCTNFTSTRQLLACVLLTCTAELAASSVSQECINCLNYHGAAAISQQLCFLAVANNTKLRFRPTFGLLLVSKYPMDNIERHRFLPNGTFFSRGYLRATVRAGRLIGDWTTVCTHLYPKVTGVPYSGSFGSAAAENLANLERIMNDSEVVRSRRVLLLGDMNHGPTLPAQPPAFPDNYRTAINNSYCSPYATQVGMCTFCKTNPYLAPNPLETGSSILDHVYVKAPFLGCLDGESNATAGGDISASRILDENITGLPIPLSDHYGVRVMITNVPDTSGGGVVTAITLCLLGSLAASLLLSRW